MNAVRFSIFAAPTVLPADVYVLLDEDFDPVAASGLEESARACIDALPNMVLVLFAVFEFAVEKVDDEPYLRARALASGLAHQRQQGRAEYVQAALYYGALEDLARTSPTGTVVVRTRMPLTHERMEATLRQLARHPAYKQQTVMVTNATHTTSLSAGVVTSARLP